MSIRSLLLRATLLGSILFGSLFFSPLLYAALSATTANVIQGSPPYLTLDDGQTKADTTDALLTLTLSNGNRYSNATEPESTRTHPIELPVAGQTFNDIATWIPQNQTNIDLTSAIRASGLWHDDNGDGQGAGGITATGELTMLIKDVDNNSVTDRATVLDGCYAPYQITLSSDKGILTTRYGLPRAADFRGATASYFISPKIDTPYVCWAQPNLALLAASPAAIWRPDKGFLPQSSTNPALNFPTVGAKGLFFNLKIASSSVKPVTWTKDPEDSGLGLTITQTDNLAKITLTGPGYRQGDSATAKPTTFTLYYGGNVLYRFKLAKWVIASRVYSNFTGAVNYCKSLAGNYRLPTVAEYTNAWQHGQGNSYLRWIGEGLFSEWGIVSAGGGLNYMVTYPESDFIFYGYWSSGGSGCASEVGSGGGNINACINRSSSRRAACITP